MNTIIDMCFLCTKDYNCVLVDDRIVSQVEYLLPEIAIIKWGIPLRICSLCEGALYAFSKFKQFYVESSRRLETSIKGAQGPLDADIAFPNPTSHLQNIGEVPHTHLLGTPPNFNLHLETNTEEISVKKKKQKQIPQEVYNTKNIEEASSNEAIDSIIQLQKGTENKKTTLSKDAKPEIEEVFIKEEPQDLEMYNMFESTLEEEKDDLEQAEESEEEIITESESQSTVQRFPCDLCGKCFSFRSNLVRHLKIHAGIKNHQCTNCNKSFTQKCHLVTHMTTCGTKAYHCDICNISYILKSSYDYHMKIHSELKDFVCSICNKAFSCRSNLNTHMKLHSEVKDFQCEICNKSYAQKYNFELHMKNHSGIKDFPCSVCGKAFACRGTLKRHMKIHSGVKEFSCEICSKPFTLKHHLDDHMKTHAGMKEF